MELDAIVDGTAYTLTVPDALIGKAEDYFARLDRDMDHGWQMSREWVPSPSLEQRCQIVADKLLTALETENHRLGRLMAAYILSRLPDVAAVELDVTGEIQNNRFHFREPPDATDATAPVAGPEKPAAQMDRLSAMAQAGRDVTKVFKVGKAYKFSVYDHAHERWQESAAITDETEAERLRQIALKARYDALLDSRS